MGTLTAKSLFPVQSPSLALSSSAASAWEMEQKVGLRFHHYWLWRQTAFCLFTFETLIWHLHSARHYSKYITNNWLTHSIFQPCKIDYYPYEETRRQRGVSHGWRAVTPGSKPRQPGTGSVPNHIPSCLASPSQDSATYNLRLSFLISNEVEMATLQRIIVKSEQDFWVKG